MDESPVSIPCGSSGRVRLDGRIHLAGSREKGVVVTHPHPLYGGNMDNPVVKRITGAFRENGFSSLRVNFRGTGQSTGRFDDGTGEQEDVRAALGYMREQGISSLYLAGYSFGAWVNAHVAASGADVIDHIMVSPPCAFLSFDTVDQLPNTGLVVTGEHDDIAPPGQIRGLLDVWDIEPVFKVLANCDHFYGARALTGLGRCLHSYLEA